MSLPTTITAKVSEPGLHYWPGAPQGRAYLSHLHRHLFVVRAVAEVHHDDRDIEFHDFGDRVRHHFCRMAPDRAFGDEGQSLLNFGPQSCEALARGVLAGLREDFGSRVVSVTVSEDDEFSATVTSERTP